MDYETTDPIDAPFPQVVHCISPTSGRPFALQVFSHTNGILFLLDLRLLLLGTSTTFHGC